eukprot:Tbor_TRINITY_DN5473_c0_g1::TRINITY_DN5473_c0_g1_i1::g.25404::m.25404
MTTSVIDFDSRIFLTIQSGFLSTAGVMLADPIVHISEVTAYTSLSSATKEVVTTLESNRLASTSRKVCTAHPVFDEVIRIVVPYKRLVQCNSDQGKDKITSQLFLVFDVEGSNGEFLGQAVGPFSLSQPSRQQSRRLMLQPRNAAFSNAGDVLFKRDIQQLESMALDDFGHLLISYDVALAPHGGVIFPTPVEGSPVPSHMPFPIGCLVKATWLTNATSATSMGSVFSTYVELTPGVRVPIDGCHPVYAALAVVQPTLTFICTSQKGAHGDPRSATVIVPLQPPTSAFMNRDVNWCHPVYENDNGSDCGVIMVTLRLTPKPLEEKDIIQAGSGAGPSDWGRPNPDCPLGANGNVIVWEGDSHVAMSVDRRWKRDCILEAHPSPEHIRHVFEACLGRVEMDPLLLPLISAFFNRPYADVSPAEMRTLLIGMSFATLSLPEALKFVFAVVRTTMPNSITVEDVVYIVHHCLASRTLDMTPEEIRRRVHDIFGAGAHSPVTFDQYVTFVVKNDCFWYDMGVAVEHGDDIRAQSSRGNRQAGVNISTNGEINRDSRDDHERISASKKNSSEWRNFTIRVAKTGRAFNVTAHRDDLVSDVMVMVEPNVSVPAFRQSWTYETLAVDPRRNIGAVIPVIPNGEVSVSEKEESVLLILVHREKNRRWEHRFPLGEKVLKLRSYVQQKTMTPLSRCALTYAGNPMWDRHLLGHYKLMDGAVIEITTE